MSGIKQNNIIVEVSEIASDQTTVVSLFQSIRQRYPVSMLLEGADYLPDDNSFSYICAEPLAEFRVESGDIIQKGPDFYERRSIKDRSEVIAALKDFKSGFVLSEKTLPSGGINGLFGYISYDAARYFDTLNLEVSEAHPAYIPEVQYYVFRWILCIDHYHQRAFLVSNTPAGEDSGTALKEFLNILKQPEVRPQSFRLVGEERSELNEEQHLQLIEKCREHIFRGDVFQIVASRRFEREYRGDDFEVYRALRAINPSPYMFYLDTGSFRLFGSSPEAELIVDADQAELHPIAGTVMRTGDRDEDLLRTERLLKDSKENAEHVMLVDLARNDLSRHCDQVRVAAFREVQTYSHVIHLVSKVRGKLRDLTVDSIDLLADTFPAGTLSGAPKYRAMELLNQYEPSQRGCYGGAIGYLGFDNSCKHAIIIRSFLSKNNHLIYQAGAGVVADSVPESEVQEVRNKLMALGKAIDAAAK